MNHLIYAPTCGHIVSPSREALASVGTNLLLICVLYAVKPSLRSHLYSSYLLLRHFWASPLSDRYMRA